MNLTHSKRERTAYAPAHAGDKQIADEYMKYEKAGQSVVSTCEPELACLLLSRSSFPHVAPLRSLADRLAHQYPNVPGVLMRQAVAAMSEAVLIPLSDAKNRKPYVAEAADTKKALAILNGVIAKHPDYSPAYFYLGKAYQRPETFPEAEKQMKKFLAMPNILPRLREYALWVTTGDMKYFHAYFD